MNAPTASHPPAETVPPEVKTGDWINLVGDYAQVCSGLYGFKFHRNGSSFASLPITRGQPDSVYFQVHGSFAGAEAVEVVGQLRDCSTGAESTHSFGHTHVTSA